MNKATAKTSWVGLAYITCFAIAGTIATSSLIFIHQAAQLSYLNLEGGPAFSAFAFTNLYFLFSVFTSLVAVVFYIVVLAAEKWRINFYTLISGILLLPSVCVILAFMKGLAR